ncbi:BMP family lipoprotein [Sphaerotilus mobilis]|uniref:Nucleoside-binding protein n=1 Tax=Sphaerotilus mobilis TaxID=47994 RepID=A0A4Q7LB73_9BURK|nr:BMP family ABC transporter substrate-binding protein [Sphaerotilus mobilis]RZS47405.1 nucleoside-binding protein [Sphaerotilus mobilis]
MTQRLSSRRLILALAAAVAGVAALPAAQAEPAVVYDAGGKFDKSFNEAAYNGIERYKKETGESYLDFEIANDTQREQAFRRMAQKGANPIIGVGFTQASAIEKVAKEFPQLKFAIVDMVVNLPNVQSVVFKEQEGSFLAGMMAAMASKTGKVGFVGGMDVPLIRRFQCGYEQGAKHANPKVEVLANMTGTTPAAWSDPTRGGELARNQFSRGVDVVFAAAGGTGVGVYQAAKDAGKLAIGVDSNQNHLHPGTMLTSMTKGVDVAVYNIAKSVKDNTFKPGISVLGLKEKGVAVAMDTHNAKLVNADMQKKLAAAEADIVAGKIKVADYMADNACKY